MKKGKGEGKMKKKEKLKEFSILLHVFSCSNFLKRNMENY
uniref:Uncharacterized protein n=1 Tax=Anguilla anguilla TaxID=7936 RepID=A0A0E9RIY2_ANGAN